MTQIYNDKGVVIPVTILEVGPCSVLQVKREDGQDKYNALKLGFDDKLEFKAKHQQKQDGGKVKAKDIYELDGFRYNRITKPMLGTFKKAGCAPKRYIQEIRVESLDMVKDYKVGDEIRVDMFKPGDVVDLIGTSKGCGFAGVVKRFHFKGNRRTHGTHESFRSLGAVSMGSTPGRIPIGTKMPGHMGDHRVTVQNIEIVKVDPEKNLLFIYGGAPGATNGYLLIQKAIKTKVRKEA
jgi:large subunit ribosomal protein L3